MQELSLYRAEFEKSKETSQRLVNLLCKHLDENSVIQISQSDAKRQLNVSQTLISNLYNRLTLNDPCIVKISRGVYQLRYSNLSERGLFVLLEKCLDKIERDDSHVITRSSQYFLMDLKLKTAYLGIQVNEVKILDGFIYKYV